MSIEVTPKLRGLVARRWNLSLETTDKDVEQIVAEKLGSGELSPEELSAASPLSKKDGSRLRQTKMFGGGSSAGGLATQKSVGLHRKSGLPVMHPDTHRPAETPSESERLKTAVLVRWSGLRAGAPIRPLDSDERYIFDQMTQEDSWTGNVNNSPNSDDGWEKAIAPGARVKALLDDSVSGGIHVVPEWFDTNLISFPLLHGELFPYVDLVDVPKGRRMVGASIDNPLVIWGTAEGTPIGLFNTADLIKPIESQVFPVACAVLGGMDWLSDATPDVGTALEQNIIQSMQASLDTVIAVGDGTTQPLGLANSSGAIEVASEGGVGGPPTLADYENLMFAIGKQYRLAGWNPSFCGNDVSYARARGMPISAVEQSRVFGTTDYNSYSVIGFPFRVAQDFPNTTIAFACLKRYRMWRRQGFSIEWHRKEGQTLALANEWLLVIRGRFGGKIVDSNAVALMSDAQS